MSSRLAAKQDAQERIREQRAAVAVKRREREADATERAAREQTRARTGRVHRVPRTRLVRDPA